jgi:hypothetical protein
MRVNSFHSGLCCPHILASGNPHVRIDTGYSSKTSIKNIDDASVTKLLSQKLNCKYFTIQSIQNHMLLFFNVKIIFLFCYIRHNLISCKVFEFPYALKGGECVKSLTP